MHREGPKAEGLTDFERALLRMVDELLYDVMVGGATWRALRFEYGDRQMMEAVFTVSQYQLGSMALNSIGLQLDPGLSSAATGRCKNSRARCM